LKVKIFLKDALRFNQKMVHRLYRTFIFAAAGWFFLLMALSCQTGTASAEMELSPADAQPAQQPGNPKVIPRKAHLEKKAFAASKQKRRRPESDYVTRSRLVTGDLQSFFSNYGGATTSGFDPDNIGLILGADIAQWALGCSFDPIISPDDQKLAILKANLTLGNFAPQSLSSNRIRRRPFNPSKIVSRDPLFLTLGSFSTPGEITGFENNDMFGTLSGFMDLQGLESEEGRKRSGSPFAYRYQKDKMSVNAGFSWINDLVDSSTSIQTYAEDGSNTTSDRVSGLNFNLGARYRALSLSGGYIRGLDRFAPVNLSLDETESQLSAWNSELAYTTELLDKETVLAVGYQRSSEALQEYLPGQRYMTKASMALFEGTTLILEYYLDKENIEKGDGSDGQGYGFTTRIGFGL
jgi:hypothetical protein